MNGWYTYANKIESTNFLFSCENIITKKRCIATGVSTM